MRDDTLRFHIGVYYTSYQHYSSFWFKTFSLLLSIQVVNSFKVIITLTFYSKCMIDAQYALGVINLTPCIKCTPCQKQMYRLVVWGCCSHLEIVSSWSLMGGIHQPASRNCRLGAAGGWYLSSWSYEHASSYLNWYF